MSSHRTDVWAVFGLARPVGLAGALRLGLLPVIVATPLWTFPHTASGYPWGLAAAAAVWALIVAPGGFRRPEDGRSVARLLLSAVVTFAVTGEALTTLTTMGRDLWWPQIVAACVLVVAALFTTSRRRRWSPLRGDGTLVLSLAEVALAEKEWIAERRRALTLPPLQPDPAVGGPVGLALSGGGIRSATVCVGFITELARLGLLHGVDYLTTVSGGGWLGTAVTALAADANGGGAYCERPAFKRLVATFRDRRRYVVITRAVGALLFGVSVTGAMLALAWAVAVGLLGWLDLQYMLDRPFPNAHALLSGLRVDRIVDTDRAVEVLRALRPIELLPLLPAVAVGLAMLALALSGVGRLSKRVAVNDAGAALRGVSILACVVGVLGTTALFGHPFFTASLLALLGVVVSGIVGWPRRAASRGTAVAITAVSPWLVDLAMPSLHLVDALTNGWYCALAHTLTIPWRAAGLGTRAQCGLREAPRFVFQTIDGPVLASFLRLYGGAAAALVVFAAIGIVFSRNNVGLHAFWRWAIDRAFFAVQPGGASGRPLATIRSAPSGAPLHVLCGAANTPSSTHPVWGRLGTARFEMSPLFVGSPATGWTDAKHYPDLTPAAAAAISAAALNSQGGVLIPGWARGFLVLFNLHLGVWLVNPRVAGDPRWGRPWSFAPLDILREVFGSNSERDPAVLVSDGGHDDNLGITALIERGCPLVVAVDAAADPTWSFADLRRSVQCLGEGWSLEVDETKSWTAPKGDALQERRQSRPVRRVVFVHRDGRRTCVLLVKSCLTGDALADPTAAAYAKAHPRFPQESTADQFFSEDQFDAYVAVGRSLARELRQAIGGSPALRAQLATPPVQPARST
ncbi:MAG: hypothetical protein JWM10_237 [Myxococcaceae bacterium]|nr:hypothetical protein [Myxococcaceae bacterium]